MRQDRRLRHRRALEREDDLAVTQVGTHCTCRRSSRTRPYTYASDVWALGCVAAELASGGKRAFDADSPRLMYKVMTCDYPPVRRTSRGGSNASWDRWTDPHEGRRRRRCCATRSCAPAEAWLAESRGPSPGGGEPEGGVQARAG